MNGALILTYTRTRYWYIVLYRRLCCIPMMAETIVLKKFHVFSFGDFVCTPYKCLHILCVVSWMQRAYITWQQMFCCRLTGNCFWFFCFFHFIFNWKIWFCCVFLKTKNKLFWIFFSQFFIVVSNCLALLFVIIGE